MLEIALILLVAVALAWPIGLYAARVFADGRRPFDALFAPIERVVLRIAGIQDAPMTAWQYGRAFVLSNLALGVLVLLVLLFQHRLPLNPDGAAPLGFDLALHTMVSFLTNTNQQHYSGQAQLSYLSQLAGLVTLQVLTPMMGLALLVAILRALSGRASGERNLGNFYVDTLRGTLRILLPLWLLLSVALGATGVPSSLDSAATAQTLDGQTEQTIPRGPMAPMVAVKQLGTNGGGWYGPNSAAPLENPNPLSNALQTIAIILLPMACVVMMGRLLRRPKLAVFTFAVMGAVSLVFVGLSVVSERAANPAFDGLAAAGPNMEGKEVRFGSDASALWATLTTQTSNGSVNAMHDSLMPLAGTVALCGMLINAIWGGIGCGLIGFLVYLILTAFLAGLMVGRTPEIFGRKLEVKEMRWIGVLVVLQPLAILAACALTFTVPEANGVSNPGFHGVAQAFYEATSAFANNGSGFEGLGDANPWWNYLCVVLLLLGRYGALLIPLIVAASLAAKPPLAVSRGTLTIETPTFAVALVAVMVLLTLLSFLPLLVLGPIGEWLVIAG